jgi:hypothetical protein
MVAYDQIKLNFEEHFEDEALELFQKVGDMLFGYDEMIIWQVLIDLVTYRIVNVDPDHSIANARYGWFVRMVSYRLEQHRQMRLRNQESAS